MTDRNNWQQLNIYLTEGDRYRHKQLYVALLEEARKQRMMGVTVTRAIAGFGTTRKIRTTSILALSADLPLVVTIVEREEAIARFMPTVREMVQAHLVTIQPIEVLSYTAVLDR